VRNVLRVQDAGHAEYTGDASSAVIDLVSCPVPDRREGAPRLTGGLTITVNPDSGAHRAYGERQVVEEFNCNYELNPAYRDRIEAAGLRVSGVGENAEARIVELADHPFFVATAFQPQLTSQEAKPHPLIKAFLEAAAG
jgi:CTP synthase (UTP-ammonia lyase)